MTPLSKKVKNYILMKEMEFSPVEKAYLQKSGRTQMQTKMPYITVDNFPDLGKFTALRFVEWVQQNPQGVISLPTGKTPEHFIKWTQYIIKNWGNEKVNAICEEHGIPLDIAPELGQLRFVQIDEFYPINPDQHNSFSWYVKEYYIKGFGLNPDLAMLIDANEITLANGLKYHEVFPELKVDLSLRYREAHSEVERIQKESIMLIDVVATKERFRKWEVLDFSSEALGLMVILPLIRVVPIISQLLVLPKPTLRLRLLPLGTWEGLKSLKIDWSLLLACNPFVISPMRWRLLLQQEKQKLKW